MTDQGVVNTFWTDDEAQASGSHRPWKIWCSKKAVFVRFQILFKKLAGAIAKNWVTTFLFLLLPVIISVALGASGLVFISFESDIEKLYVPRNAPSLKDRKIIEELYADYGDNNTLQYQRTRLGPYGQVLVVPEESGNVLSFAILEDALRLHDYILNISIPVSGDSYTYQDLCMIWQNECHSNGILDAINYNASTIHVLNITYPYVNLPMKTFIGNELGGVTFYPNSDVIKEARALQLTYNLRYDTSEEEVLGKKWENEFLRRVEKFTSSSNASIFRRTSHTLEQELNKATSSIVTSFVITFTVLISFSITSCMTIDMLRTKTWLGGLGVISAGLAIMSSFGLMSLCGVPFINEVGSMPFLILGIGVDDMFIMIAAWRKTNVRAKAKGRLQTAFSEAATSITITSVTDVLAFCIGAITPFRSVQIFCIYTGVAVAFTYTYQITFFGACMYIDGLREQHHLNGIIPFLKMSGPSQIRPEQATVDERNETYEMNGGHKTQPAIVSGINARQQNNDDQAHHVEPMEEFTNHRAMMCFRDYVAPFLMKEQISTILMMLYTVYLVCAIFGIQKLETGLQLSNLLPDHSYAQQYYKLESTYFTKYGPVVMITINEEAQYWDKDIQMKIEETLKDLEGSQFYHDDDISISWLRDYLKFLDDIGIPNPNETEFKTNLKDKFLPLFQHYGPDIVFRARTNDIISTRSYVTFKDVDSSTLEEKAMSEARQIVGTREIAQIAYHPAFTFYDQYTVVVFNTVRNLLLAVVVMFLVTLLMMPNFKGAFFALFSILSILVGVIGYMAYWGVYLDTVSMVNLVLCVGFSVDYSAHMILAYFSAPRTIHALYTHGWPITQGAMSTILGIIVLAFSTSYIFRSFFKTMFLVISFGALHGLIILPLILKLFGGKVMNGCHHSP
ncbi:patched domain-containing protein 3-like [Amphiura filiformis]|uniref:patched domain-containing protein 3-like n=1 Tax=Amphiura filiformis TaxID=82378 RepID=UPI003B217E8A